MPGGRCTPTTTARTKSRSDPWAGKSAGLIDQMECAVDGDAWVAPYSRGMATLVRRAVVEDAPQIAALHAAARLAAYGDFISPELLSATFSGDFTELWAQRLGADEPPVVLVAVRGGELVGYCMLLLPSDDDDSDGVVPEITRMSVSPHAWRSGIGSALLDEAISALRRDGWDGISLWVLERNVHAQAFYTAFGFRVDGGEMIDEWSGQPQVRMRLDLNEPAA
jgi:ribosomal protein S18 acetylase RimI-like enzyme